MPPLIVHPGVILETSFLKPLQLSVYRLAKETGIPESRLGQIIHGKRSISVDTALRLSKYFELDELFWLQAQALYDIEKVRAEMQPALEKITPYTPTQLKKHGHRA